MKSRDAITIGVLAGVVAILDFIGVIGIPTGIFSVSAFYIGAAFFTAFSLWFKERGLIAIYLGLLIGAILSGTFTIFAFILALGNVIGAAVPLVLFRLMRADFTIKNTKDFITFIVSAPIGQNIVSAVWTIGGFYVFGIMPLDAAKVALFGWVVGGVVVQLVIGIPLLKTIGPIVKRTNVYR